MASALTPLGTRTRAGFIKKYGAKEGAKKFTEAMDKGLIDRSKMENLGIDDGESVDAEEERQATPGNPSGGGQPLPKGNVGRGAPGTFQKRPG
jgi:hypothetical protein